MCVITRSAHSLNRFACPGGNSGVVNSTQDYNSRITVEEESMTVTVDAGVELRKLLDRLAVKGLALPHTTDWDGLSMAGVICCGFHWKSWPLGDHFSGQSPPRRSGKWHSRPDLLSTGDGEERCRKQGNGGIEQCEDKYEYPLQVSEDAGGVRH
ncbi:hypothetical protein SUGI_0710030 [Cryptomeria japonica]|nr:hypothetical protein SUGI_0710030 [Cryptomeria japonica]